MKGLWGAVEELLRKRVAEETVGQEGEFGQRGEEPGHLRGGRSARSTKERPLSARPSRGGGVGLQQPSQVPPESTRHLRRVVGVGGGRVNQAGQNLIYALPTT